jgi:hypothetical protein
MLKHIISSSSQDPTPHRKTPSSPHSNRKTPAQSSSIGRGRTFRGRSGARHALPLELLSRRTLRPTLCRRQPAFRCAERLCSASAQVGPKLRLSNAVSKARQDRPGGAKPESSAVSPIYERLVGNAAKVFHYFAGVEGSAARGMEPFRFKVVSLHLSFHHISFSYPRCQCGKLGQRAEVTERTEDFAHKGHRAVSGE